MEKLAIIGTGIAGMGAAYLLKDYFDITLFEKNNYVGGHTNTVSVNEQGKEIYIDTGFMVFNKVTYPNLTKLFERLDVPIKPTSMSFSVNHVKTGLEYNGSGLKGLFSQRKNIFNPKFISMLFQINRFNNDCSEVLVDEKYNSYSLKDYVDEKGYGNEMLEKYLIPMSSAVWSTPPDKMLGFPAKTLIRFFYNHGFLGLNTEHQWYTVENGSRVYRDKLIDDFKNKIILNNEAIKVTRANNKIEVVTKDLQKHFYDKVIIASHADESLKILADATELETQLLSKFNYQYNKATLHTDASVMPRNKKIWSSWNYRIEEKSGEVKTSTIYYMNSLQQVSKRKDYFVSIDDPGNIDKNKIIKEIDYTHPIFLLDAIEAQKNLDKINSQGNNTFYCGSYFKYGFHEDAFTSAVELSNKLTDGKAWL